METERIILLGVLLFSIILISLIDCSDNPPKKKDKRKTLEKNGNDNSLQTLKNLEINNDSRKKKNNIINNEEDIHEKSSSNLLYRKSRNVVEYKSNSKIKANNNNNYINDYNYNNNLINEINYFNSQSKSKEKAIDQNQFKGKSKSIDDYMYMYDLQDIVNNERIIIMSIQLSGEKEEDNIIEICCIEMINRKKTKNKFHSFFRPRNEMTVDLKEKYKIPEEVFKYNSRKLQLLYKELLDFIGESLIFIYNVNDELGKINKELQYYKLTSIKKYQCIDI